MLMNRGAVAYRDKFDKILFSHGILAGKNSAAHGIEHHDCKAVIAMDFTVGNLQAVRTGDDFFQGGGPGFDIALEVGEGEVVALLGRNGAGKSTTFRSIIGLVENRSGRIVFEGRDVSAEPTHAIVRGGLGYVPEERRIFTDLTVEENLEVGRQPQRPNAPYWTREKLFTLFPNLGEMRNRPGGRMSGGEQQMLAIGRALMCRPRILLLDEPSFGIAPIIVDRIFEVIQQLNAGGLTTLLVEQNVTLALDVCSRAYVLENGHVVLAGSSSDIAADKTVRGTYLGM